MAQLVVRNIANETKMRLKKRAHRNGRSMEEEARDILRDAVKEESRRGGIGSEIAALFQRIGIVQDVAELHGQTIKPPSFER